MDAGGLRRAAARASCQGARAPRVTFAGGRGPLPRRRAGSRSGGLTGTGSGSPAEDRARRGGRARGRRARRRLDGRRPSNLTFAGPARTPHAPPIPARAGARGRGRRAPPFALGLEAPAHLRGRGRVQPAPEASFEGGLDLVAPVAHGRALGLPARVVRGRPRCATRPWPRLPSTRTRRPDRGRLDQPLPLRPTADSAKSCPSSLRGRRDGAVEPLARLGRARLSGPGLGGTRAGLDAGCSLNFAHVLDRRSALWPPSASSAGRMMRLTRVVDGRARRSRVWRGLNVGARRRVDGKG